MKGKFEIIFTYCFLIGIKLTLFSQQVDPNFKPVIKGVPHVKAIGIQNDGKIVIGGYISSIGMKPCASVLRLNQDGSYDQTFQSSIPYANIQSIEIDKDNRILVGAYDFNLNKTDQIVD